MEKIGGGRNNASGHWALCRQARRTGGTVANVDGAVDDLGALAGCHVPENDLACGARGCEEFAVRREGDGMENLPRPV